VAKSLARASHVSGGMPMLKLKGENAGQSSISIREVWQSRNEGKPLDVRQSGTPIEILKEISDDFIGYS